MKTDHLILRSLGKLLAVWLTILLGMANGWAVMLSPTSAQLSVTPNPAMAGQTVTLTMTVTGTNPAAPPTGQVTFKEGLAVLGSVNLNNGIAALNTQFSTAGIHGITASYAGDGNNGGTSMTTWFTITAAATTTQLVPSANPVRPDQAVTLTATVTGVNPTGTVTFKNGNTLLGSALLTAGTASITRTFGAVGNYPLTAGYNGDTNNLASTSSPLTLTVSIEPQVYYIHTDHLHTPREITDTAGNVVWQWSNTDPFGANMPNENPGGAGQFSFNLRFAGQYFDRETGTHYNFKRDYDPATGRFLQPDPLGLSYHLNPYSYANYNPLSYYDPTGEAATIAWCFGGPAACAIGVTAAVGSLIWAQSHLSNTKIGAEASSGSVSQCKDDNDSECWKLRQRDEAACSLLSGTRYGSRGVGVCMNSAAERYAECLRFGPSGVKTPLHGVDTPL